MTIEGPPLSPPPPLHLSFAAGVAARAEQLVVTTLDQGELTWRELDQQSERLARHYLALGLERGERIAFLLPNMPGLLIHQIACLKAGLVSVPLNYRYRPPEIDHALEVSEAALLIHHAERSEDIALCQRVPDVSKGLLVAGGKGQNDLGFNQLLSTSPPPGPEPRPTEADEPLLIYFTSGSTGPAKGVTHTAGSMAWTVESVAQSLALVPDDIYLTPSSHAHIAASASFFAVLRAQASLAMATELTPGHILELIRQARPTKTIMLPSMLWAILNQEDCKRADFSSFRYLATSGDKAAPAVASRFEALTAQALAEAYGSTEAFQTSLARPGETVRAGSAGRPGQGITVSIRDDAGRELPPGEIGRLWVRHPGAMVGYWRRPDDTAAVFDAEGWFDSGDLFEADSEGCLWFRGRKKQIIVHDGSNIAPQEVEASLLEHPAVNRAGVVGVANREHGENVWAFVELRRGAERPLPEALIAHSRQRVGYKAPEVVTILDALPVNATGKVDRTALRTLAASRTSHEESPSKD